MSNLEIEKPNTKNLSFIIVIALIAILVSVNFAVYPFSKVIVSRTVSLRPLSYEQQNNLFQAAQRIDGQIINPGQVFSFNAKVGPRTGKRGYQPAPSYLGKETPSTIGGGICLLSSCLYQAALTAGLKIVERVPHLRTVQTVQPGFDATVWYGRADLRFENNTDEPIEIRAYTNASQLKVELRGSDTAAQIVKKAELRRLEQRRAPGELLVEVFRTTSERDVFVSRDLYRTDSRSR
ncbi:MAG: vanomycin resistance protein VanB [Cyanobacteria bacterium PR.3.49]|nr:vanomycin resistance protein VanB [Cyanobacteria bacterium PR.3.49]